MTHFISGVVGSPSGLSRVGELTGQPAVELSQGLQFIPIAEENFAALRVSDGEPVGKFYTLTHPLLDRLRSLSEGAEFAYVETEYFGGTGAQGAVVFRDGNCVFGPEEREAGPINKALAMLGVDGTGSHDEFEAAGLHLHRTNDDWRRAAQSS
jgi:hypothetical protein